MTRDTWHMTHDTWHMTHNTWHMTHDIWHMVGGVNILSKFQLSSSNGLGFMMLWISWGKGLINQSISHGGVCRTAPATPGLLNRAREKTKTVLKSHWHGEQLGNMAINWSWLIHFKNHPNATVVIVVTVVTKQKFHPDNFFHQ